VKPIAVSGLINIETTLRVDAFPIEYTPVRYPFFGVQSTVSGVGLNVAAALRALGREVELFSIVGADADGARVRHELGVHDISDDHVLSLIDQTPASVILFDGTGRRLCNTDLKDIQEAAYPCDVFAHVLESSDSAVLCNINFSRPFLQVAKDAGKWIYTDVHVLADVHDDYNADFMRAADVLFLSNEAIVGREREFVSELSGVYGNGVIVVGLGSEGALLFDGITKWFHEVSARLTRPIVNTIGAGDALFSCFVEGHSRGLAPLVALQRAVVFAGHKIGATGAAEGFLSAAELDALLG
jgi:sugar/nucleoside kinase (ribokinase family)